MTLARVDRAFSNWLEEGRQLGRVARTYQWILADWLISGERRWGDRATQEACGALGLAEHTVLNILSVARAWPESRRREGLTFSHHEALVSLPAPEQDRLLDEAEKSALSVTALRRLAHNGTPRTSPQRLAQMDESAEPPRLTVGSLVRLDGALAKITHIGRPGPTILMTAVRL